MTTFATYFHEDVFISSKPMDALEFIGHSVPYFNQVRGILAEYAKHIPQLPLRKAEFVDFYRVHDTQYLDTILRYAQGLPVTEHATLSMECTSYEFFLDGYCYGLGGFYAAIDEMKKGSLDRTYIFSLGGHHAFPARGHGYCMLNPLAAAVRYAQDIGFAKVLILDWDIHHGDGTQSIFEHDDSVYHISIHNVLDLYMVFQRVMRLGLDSYARSVGHCNIPVVPTLFDDATVAKFELGDTYYRTDTCLAALQHELANLPFVPDLVFVFSGYDSHKNDVGTDTTAWVEDDYVFLTRMIVDLAQQASIPLIVTHGGGYKLEHTIPSAKAVIDTLLNY